jgi:hypothetical protein
MQNALFFSFRAVFYCIPTGITQRWPISLNTVEYAEKLHIATIWVSLDMLTNELNVRLSAHEVNDFFTCAYIYRYSKVSIHNAYDFSDFIWVTVWGSDLGYEHLQNN